MIYMDDSSKQKFDAALEAGTTQDRYLSSKASIIEYYKGTYTGRGKDGWKQHIVKDLSRLTGQKEKTLEKRFDPQRLNNVEKKNASQYEKLGRTLPPIKVPKPWQGKRAVVTTKIYIVFSGKVYTKDFTRTLSVQQTDEMMGRGGVDAIIENYGINPEDVEELEIGTIVVDFI